MPRIPLLLSINAGFVDTATYLALHGLFAAHVTGNFVTLGSSLEEGSSGAIAKLIATPVFCLVILATRFLISPLRNNSLALFHTMLSLIALLLTIAAVLAVRFGPFANADTLTALATGMVLVSAMAIQNAAQRAYLPKAPPSTMMTGTTTQIMIDIADIIRGRASEAGAVAKARLLAMLKTVAAFAFGCAAGAFLFAIVHEWCFAAPALLALIVLLVALFADKTDPLSDGVH